MCFQGQSGTLQDSQKLQPLSHSPQFSAWNSWHWKVRISWIPHLAISSLPPLQPCCLFCNTVKPAMIVLCLQFREHHPGFYCVNFAKPPSPQEVVSGSTPVLSTWRKYHTHATSAGRGRALKRIIMTTWICTTKSKLTGVPTVTSLTPTRRASGNMCAMAFAANPKCRTVIRDHYSIIGVLFTSGYRDFW